MSISPNMQTLRDQILGLSVTERVTLLDDIWDSLPDDAPHSPLSDARRNELERRLAAQQANPIPGDSWESVKREITGR
jgi:putative addiction module component (TIGR02574 family)